MTVHRIKSYSAESGYVYQYCFAQSRPAECSRAGAGTEYVFTVSRDRKHNFDVPVLLRQDAVEHWAASHGRPLDGTEQYAAVKMRLFSAFDEMDDLERDRLKVEVTPQNIDELLAALDIG